VLEAVARLIVAVLTPEQTSRFLARMIDPRPNGHEREQSAVLRA